LPGSKPPHQGTIKIMHNLDDYPLLIDLHFHDLRYEATSRLTDKL